MKVADISPRLGGLDLPSTARAAPETNFEDHLEAAGAQDSSARSGSAAGAAPPRSDRDIRRAGDARSPRRTDSRENTKRTERDKDKDADDDQAVDDADKAGEPAKPKAAKDSSDAKSDGTGKPTTGGVKKDDDGDEKRDDSAAVEAESTLQEIGATLAALSQSIAIVVKMPKAEGSTPQATPVSASGVGAGSASSSAAATGAAATSSASVKALEATNSDTKNSPAKPSSAGGAAAAAAGDGAANAAAPTAEQGEAAQKSQASGNAQAITQAVDHAKATAPDKPAEPNDKPTEIEITAALPKPQDLNPAPSAEPAARAPSPAQGASRAAPLSPPPPPVMESDPNVARVARGLQNAIAQRGGSVTLRLQPPELGLVRIELAVTNGAASVRFHADDESVRTLLSHQMGNLRQALEGHGLSVERMDVQTMPSVSTPERQADESPDNGRSRGQFFSQQQGGGSAREQRTAPEQPESFSQALVNTVA